jgi:hypothetical protein
MFTDLNFRFPEQHLGKETHPYLKVWKKSTPSPTTRPAKTTAAKAPVQKESLKDGSLLSFLLQEKILFSKKSTPIFSTLFPSTSIPKITFVCGTPKIDRSLFTTLLVSQLRAAKSALLQADIRPPKNFSTSVVLAFSRQIDRSLIQQLSYSQAKSKAEDAPTTKTKLAQAKSKSTNTSTQKKSKPQAKTPQPQTLQDRFVPSSIKEETPAPVEVTRPPSPPLVPSEIPELIMSEISNAKDILRTFRLFDSYQRSTQNDLSADPRARAMLTQLANLDEPGFVQVALTSESYIPIKFFSTSDLLTYARKVMASKPLLAYDEFSDAKYSLPAFPSRPVFEWTPPSPKIVEKIIRVPGSPAPCSHEGLECPYCYRYINSLN